MNRAYYNEIDLYAAQWLRNLIDAGHIAPGDVDTRSIEDVTPNDLRGYTQCHFFAGIGVWSYALRLAGWPDDAPVWTGSCPCQPFSQAGKGRGTADERHLWPAWFHLIELCRPSVIFGEQVASKDGLAWLDLVQTDLEGASYATGAFDLCAAGVGAPHIRQRIYFVADNNNTRRIEYAQRDSASLSRSEEGALGNNAGGRGELGDTNNKRSQGWSKRGDSANQCLVGQTGVAGFWRNAEWISCRDGKRRPIEPGTFPLVDGASARVGRLRAYGNAIVAPLAAEFIGAYLDLQR